MRYFEINKDEYDLKQSYIELYRTLPKSFPNEFIDEMLSWEHIYKSPRSFSYYNVPHPHVDPPIGYKRISDHWNVFQQHGKHKYFMFPADIPHNLTKIWALGIWNGDSFEIKKTLPFAFGKDVFDRQIKFVNSVEWPAYVQNLIEKFKENNNKLIFKDLNFEEQDAFHELSSFKLTYVNDTIVSLKDHIFANLK